MSGSDTSSRAGFDLQTVLDRLWLEHCDLIQSRLSAVRCAVDAREAGTLTAGDRLCRSASEEAHKLAGSLGSFGLQAATEAARRIEGILDGSYVSGGPQLRSLYDEVAQAIESRSAIAKAGSL